MFDRQCQSKNQKIDTKFMYSLCPFHKKIPLHKQYKMKKAKEIFEECHIERLDKFTSDCFITQIVIVVKKRRFYKIGIRCNTD